MKAVSLEQPEVISVIIGDGQERQALQELIKQEQVGQNVFLAGYLDFAAEYMKAFSVFVLPSKKEGLPYAILEAGAAGLPVVATTVGGIPEIVEDMKSGILIQSANYRELSHAISFMVSHPEERRKYGAALKERVATKFSLDKMIWMVESLYQEKRN
jgi:glycosyltransferase involved in cell wall biosynthesis